MAGTTLRVPTKERPTFWNKDAAVGFVIANVFGLVIGGLIGKSRMERESKDGKLVSPASFWNKDTIIGAAIGSVVGTGMFWLAGLAIASGMIAAGGAAAAAVAAVGLGAALLGPVVGFIAGGNHGKKQQTKEYAQAQAYVLQHGEFNPYLAQQISVAPVMQNQRATTITQEEAALLEARLNNPNRSFAKDIETRTSTPDAARAL